MRPEHLERLRALEGKAPTEASELVRERLRELGIGADPFDIGEAQLIEAIFGEAPE